MKLRVLSGALASTAFELQEGLNLIGRDCESAEHNVIDLADGDDEAKISRRHAMIQVQDGCSTIWDLGSLNGTLINRGDPLVAGDHKILQIGDEVIVGKTALMVVDE